MELEKAYEISRQAMGSALVYLWQSLEIIEKAQDELFEMELEKVYEILDDLKTGQARIRRSILELSVQPFTDEINNK